MARTPLIFFFFLNDPATTEISTLPLHDALPISVGGLGAGVSRLDRRDEPAARLARGEDVVHARAHEHFAQRRERPCAAGEAERVRRRYPQGAGAESTPVVRRQAVGSPRGLPRGGRRGDGAGGAGGRRAHGGGPAEGGRAGRVGCGGGGG